jgi:uncharacterized ion transporter superfamily protein YfcC
MSHKDHGEYGHKGHEEHKAGFSVPQTFVIFLSFVALVSVPTWWL